MLENAAPRALPHGISLHILGDEAVLFDRIGQKLYAANTTAAVIWCCLEERMPPNEIADFLADRMDIDPASATRYIGEIHRWASQAMASRPASKRRESRPGPSAAGTFSAIERPSAATRHYRLLDSIVVMRFDSLRLTRRVDRLLGHLAANDTSAARSGAVFDVVTDGGGAAVLEGGKFVDRCPSLDQLGALAKSCVVLRALEESTDLYAIHAGAVRRGDRCILLPGSSGSGKSTLVAGLVSEGFQLMADDTVVLSRHPVAVRPVACGICVKSGAWEPLAIRFPRLRRRMIESRPDGQSVRYLLPPEYPVADVDARVPVGWIVFPRYRPGQPTAIDPIGKGAALHRLMDCFVALRGRLDDADVRRLVEWISDIPCYDLQASSLTEAVWLLGRMDT